MLFPENLENFGIILKGSSIVRLGEISNNFDHCFIVNNIDKNKNNRDSEYSLVAPLIKNKSIVHFVNRLKTASLQRQHYSELGIKNIQFTKSELDKELIKVKRIYEKYKLKCHMLPEELLSYNKYFDGKGDYEKKHPNTGVLSIIYATKIIKPRNLWIVGLDFYESDYLFRRPWHWDLKNQREKMERLDIPGQFIKLVDDNFQVQFNVISKASLPELKNLNVL
tara:strand:+ start:425 stop:1093 length:669 start_codon:yes stop_codon:yes gene_type:complete